VLCGIGVCVLVLAAAAAFGLRRRYRDGKLNAPGPGQVTAVQLGQPLGTRATLLQFSSEFCAPCRATRQVLGDVASGLDGVSHVEVDAAERLDLVRLLDVRRTPTVFVLGPDGRVTRRGSGLMRRDEVLAALGDAG
jgi:thiol-disulfide isomerase/thioredoxin